MFQVLSRVLGLSSSTSTKRDQKKKARRFQPNVEALETREVPTATLFKDVNVGPESSTPQELVNVNGTLFFSADDGIFGRELWMRRGNVVQKVLDIRPGPDGSNPTELTEVGNRLYFSADDGLHGRELWRTVVGPNGAILATHLVQDINPGIASSDPGELTAFAPNPDRFNPSKTDSSKAVRLYFAATHISFGRELWTTPGRNAIIERIEINPGTADSAPSYLTVAKVRQRGRLINVLYFAADRLGFGRELWRTNLRGQAAGIVMDIRGGAEGSNPFNLTKVSPRNPDRADTVFLGADNGFFGAELWRSNGQFAGTFLIEDINPGGPDSHSLEESATTLMAEFKHRLYFAADDGRVGRELWRSGRARGSATLVRDINPGVNSSNPTAQEHPLPKLRNLIFRRRRPDNVFVDHLLFFGADNGTMGGEPWRTSGTFGGTVILRDIRVGPDSSLIQNELVGIVFPQRPPTPPERLQPNRRQVLHFAADDGFFGRELWRSDGNINNPLFNTRRDETDINPGPPSSTPSFFEISPGGVFFAADKDFLGRELWRVNPIP